MSVSATPQRPKPDERMVEPDWTSATAASASGNSLDPPRLGVGALVSAPAEGRADRRGVEDEMGRWCEGRASGIAMKLVGFAVLTQL